jgi:hypothetical protein
MFSIREIIDIAIKIEKNGESFYREAMEKISNPALKPVLHSGLKSSKIRQRQQRGSRKWPKLMKQCFRIW